MYAASYGRHDWTRADGLSFARRLVLAPRCPCISLSSLCVRVCLSPAFSLRALTASLAHHAFLNVSLPLSPLFLAVSAPTLVLLLFSARPLPCPGRWRRGCSACWRSGHPRWGTGFPPSGTRRCRKNKEKKCTTPGARQEACTHEHAYVHQGSETTGSQSTPCEQWTQANTAKNTKTHLPRERRPAHNSLVDQS